ncbi:SCO family protein [Bacillus pinisoli]|uniref:SCO family protein n=1 Tax=Bacillus pinisoli TaxID=2901866 RepID=UPI001FF2B32A|nr:SCO family protein [Bacillus pinisoli]
MKKWIWVMLVVAGSVLVYFLWPNDEKLPALKSIEPFQVETMEGDTYDFNNNKVKIVAFFYTNCPDICPLTFVDLKQLQEQLKEKGTFAEKIEFVTVTLDPEFDTKERLVQYANAFDVDPTGWKVVRTSLEQTDDIATDFQMSFKKEDNFIVHRTTMYLVDADHKIRALYDMADPDEKVDLNQIMMDLTELVE